MIKFNGINKFIPATWIVQFHSHDAAHNYYMDSIDRFDDTIGTLNVNNYTWYIITKLDDKEFNDKLTKFMNNARIADSEYVVSKARSGWIVIW